MRFKLDWASLIVGSKNLPFLLCFSLCLRAIFQVQAPRAAYIWRGDLTEGFLRYRLGGLIFGGAYFRNFMVIHYPLLWPNSIKVWDEIPVVGHDKGLQVLVMSEKGREGGRADPFH